MIKFLDCKFDNEHDNLFIQSIKSWPPCPVLCWAPTGVFVRRGFHPRGGAYSLVKTRHINRNNSRTTSFQALFKQMQASMAEPSDEDCRDVQMREGALSLCPHCPCPGCTPGPSLEDADTASLSLRLQSCPFQPILHTEVVEVFSNCRSDSGCFPSP